jgi:RimJ/RimL family protein N-acetyltransferase
MVNEKAKPTRYRLVMCGIDGLPLEPEIRVVGTNAEYAAMVASLYSKVGYEPPWVSYLVLEGQVPVGGCAFVAPPSNGLVEIAYYTLPEFQRHGVATFAAAELIEIAKQSAPYPALMAKTLPELNPSTRILRRHGFQNVGSVSDEDVGEAWEWRLLPQ